MVGDGAVGSVPGRGTASNAASAARAKSGHPFLKVSANQLPWLWSWEVWEKLVAREKTIF